MLTKKGFVFSIMFLLFFTLFLSFAIFYTQIKKETKPQTIGFITDDIKDDVIRIHGTKTTITNHENFTVITFSDTLPNTINPDQELEEYKKFLKTYYGPRTNNNVTLNSLTPAITIRPFGLTYNHNSLKKNRVSISSTEKIGAYLIRVKLPQNCDVACTFNTQTNWKWANDGIFVVLDITDPQNNILLINGNASGFINQTSSIDLSLASGSYHLDVYDALNEEVSNLNIDSNISVYYASTPATTATIPVDLEINNVKIRELTISKN